MQENTENFSFLNIPYQEALWEIVGEEELQPLIQRMCDLSGFSWSITDIQGKVRTGEIELCCSPCDERKLSPPL